MSATFPPVIITEASAPLVPGDCDMAGCTHRASYAIGNYYVCAGCLIDGCEKNQIPLGTVVYRVPERMHFY